MLRKTFVSLSFAAVVVFGVHAAAGAQAKPGLGGSITGTVTFTGGSPVVNRVVEWRPNGDPNGGSTVQTNTSGAYTIQGLKDGEYFVGYFPPDRLPADKNRNVEVAPDSQSPGLSTVGPPLIRRVTIKGGGFVSGIDFVITNIGDERFAGPDSGDGTAPEPRLPATGAPAAAGGSSGERGWLPWAIGGAALLGVLSIAAAAWPVATRRRS